MMPQSLLVLVVIVASSAGCVTRQHGGPPPWTSVWKSETPFSQPISDPMAWAASQFMDQQDASVEEARIESFEADIDHDSVPELFVTSQWLHGNAGGPYLAFRRSGSSFRYIGQIGMSRHSFRVLPLGPDKRPRVLVYWRIGGGETGSGTLATLSNDGSSFTTVHTEEVSGENASRRYEEAFSR